MRHAVLVRLISPVPCVALGCLALWFAAVSWRDARRRTHELAIWPGCAVSMDVAPSMSGSSPVHDPHSGWCQLERGVVVAAWAHAVRRGHIPHLAIAGAAGTDSVALDVHRPESLPVGTTVTVLRQFQAGEASRRGAIIAVAGDASVFTTQAHPQHAVRQAAGFLMAALLAFGMAGLMMVLLRDPPQEPARL